MYQTTSAPTLSSLSRKKSQVRYVYMCVCVYVYIYIRRLPDAVKPVKKEKVK